MNTKTWTTEAGETLKIKDMTTTHIQNCIKFLQRKIDNGETFHISGSPDGDIEDATEKYQEQIKIFQKELSKR